MQFEKEEPMCFSQFRKVSRDFNHRPSSILPMLLYQELFCSLKINHTKKGSKTTQTEEQAQMIQLSIKEQMKSQSAA